MIFIDFSEDNKHKQRAKSFDLAHRDFKADIKPIRPVLDVRYSH